MMGVLALTLVCSVSGCALFRFGPSDEQLLGDLLKGWKAAMDEGSVEKVIAYYSKDYMSADGRNFEETKSGLERIVPALKEFEAKLSTTDAKIQIEGKKATIAPIKIESSLGSIGLTLITTKDKDGVWRITSSEMQR